MSRQGRGDRRVGFPTTPPSAQAQFIALPLHRGAGAARPADCHGSSEQGTQMDFNDVFLNCEGRIGRRRAWIGLVAVDAVVLACKWASGVPLISDIADVRLRIIAAAVDLLFLYPAVAIVIKRLHDRNRRGAYAVLYVAAAAVMTGGDLFGYFSDASSFDVVTWLAAAFVLVVGLGFLIELGFRRGTAGPNRFGPEPSAGGGKPASLPFEGEPSGTRST
jgi:uncharacterized membrane protein YhaH (DUF805 family)